MDRFFVINEDNYTSYNERADSGESFKTQKLALKRATELAQSCPGDNYYICKSTHIVRCPVAPVETTDLDE